MFEAPRASGFDDDRVQPHTTETGVAPSPGTFQRGRRALRARAGAVLTPAAVYSDREVGSELAKYARRDRTRLRRRRALDVCRAGARAQFPAGIGRPLRRPRRAAGAVDVEPATTAESSHWTLETAEPSQIDPELEPIVEQGITLALPLVDQAARRAYMVRQQARSKPEFASQEWVERQMTDDGEGFSQGDLIEILRSSFALVLSRRWESPPPFFGDSDEPAPRWGWEAQFAPEGPALLPTIDGVLLGSSGGAGNAACGVPPAPQAGSLGAGVCIQARATRPIAEGELIQT